MVVLHRLDELQAEAPCTRAEQAGDQGGIVLVAIVPCQQVRIVVMLPPRPPVGNCHGVVVKPRSDPVAQEVRPSVADVNRRRNGTPDRRAKGALTHFRCSGSSCGRGESGTQKIEFSAPIHLSSNELELGDLALGLAIRPRLAQGCRNGSLILLQATGEGR